MSETSGLDLLISFGLDFLIESGTGTLFVAEDLGVNSLALGLSGTNSLALGLSVVLEQTCCCSTVEDPGDPESSEDVMAVAAVAKAADPQLKSEFTHLLNVP